MDLIKDGFYVTKLVPSDETTYIRNAISSVKKLTAPGPNRIRPEHLKNFPPALINNLALLFTLPLCLTFIDLKKAFDSVETEAVIDALLTQDKSIQQHKLEREPFYYVVVTENVRNGRVIRLPRWSLSGSSFIKLDVVDALKSSLQGDAMKEVQCPVQSASHISQKIGVSKLSPESRDLVVPFYEFYGYSKDDDVNY
uniref:Reverse transcriptase domain-containing protein n=1 Tax=Heligmosomoides polygyrus TaxID=6339 RepID=A0A183F1Y0_HELPZ